MKLPLSSVTALVLFMLAAMQPPLMASGTGTDLTSKAVQNRIETPVRESISIRQQSQHAREKWMKERAVLEAELKRLEEENRQLSDRKKSLVVTVSETERRIDTRKRELEGLNQLEREILPFLQETLAWLRAETDQGLPFLVDERKNRVTRLENILDDPEVRIAEKFRRTMEALQIEADYGISVEVTRESINLDNQKLLVTLLRLGRLNLFFTSIDGLKCGWYNMAAGRYQLLPGKYNHAINQAVAMAIKRRPVEFVNLPVGRLAVK